MNIKVIGSGSSGNCYRIDDGESALLLEAGLPIRKIKEGCDYDMKSIAACFVSHSHKDHSKAARDVMAAGVELCCSAETASECALDGSYRLHVLEPLVTVHAGSFDIFPFPVHHDVATFGYLIRSMQTDEKLLFITDSCYTEYKFPGLAYVMIEANYSDAALTDDPRAHRLRRSHMSIENCIEMLKANDLSCCREILLIHLSESNADPENFKQRVQEATGCPTYIA